MTQKLYKRTTLACLLAGSSLLGCGNPEHYTNPPKPHRIQTVQYLLYQNRKNPPKYFKKLHETLLEQLTIEVMEDLEKITEYGASKIMGERVDIPTPELLEYKYNIEFFHNSSIFNSWLISRKHSSKGKYTVKLIADHFGDSLGDALNDPNTNKFNPIFYNYYLKKLSLKDARTQVHSLLEKIGKNIGLSKSQLTQNAKKNDCGILDLGGLTQYRWLYQNILLSQSEFCNFPSVIYVAAAHETYHKIIFDK